MRFKLIEFAKTVCRFLFDLLVLENFAEEDDNSASKDWFVRRVEQRTCCHQTRISSSSSFSQRSMFSLSLLYNILWISFTQFLLVFFTQCVEHSFWIHDLTVSIIIVDLRANIVHLVHVLSSQVCLKSKPLLLQRPNFPQLVLKPL